MAQFKFECPHCKQHLEAETDWIGQFAECPSCGKEVEIQMKKIQLKKVETEPAGSTLQRCTTCGHNISSQAKICPSCGASNPNFVHQKSAWVYALLFWLFAGAGAHTVYAGYTMRAMARVLAFIISLFIIAAGSFDGEITFTAIIGVCGAIACIAWSTIEFASTTKDSDGVPFK